MGDNSNIDLENSKDKNSPNQILELQESFSSSNKSNNDHEIIKALNKSPLKSKKKDHDHIILKESFQEHDNDKTLFTSDNSEVKKNISDNSVNLNYSKKKYFSSADNNSIILPNPKSPKKFNFIKIY